MPAGSPVSGSNSRPIRAARTSSARKLSASLLVMNDFDRPRPAACQRTSNGRRRPARRLIAYTLTSNLFTLAPCLAPRPDGRTSP